MSESKDIPEMTLLEIARDYVSRGFSVIPIRPKQKIPAMASWKEFQERRPNDDELRSWFEGRSIGEVGIGIVTGDISGIDVVDLDTPEAVEFANKNFPQTPTVRTGKGEHLIFRHCGGARNSQSGVFSGIDIRAEGGYIVAPPSIHSSGAQYKWMEDKGLDDLPFAELPEIFYQQERQATRESAIEDGVPVGMRNNTLASLCGTWTNAGCTLGQCFEKAFEWNSKNPLPLNDVELVRTVKSIYDLHQAEVGHNDSNAVEVPSPLADCVIEYPSLRDMVIPERNRINRFLCHGDLVEIYGPRGIGKTWFTGGLACSTATGRPFIKWGAPPSPIGVLLVDGEMPLKDQQERLAMFLRDEVPGHLTILSNEQVYRKMESDLNLVRPDIQQQILAILDNRPEIGLVILDNVSTLFPGLRENEKLDWEKAACFLLQLRRRSIAVVIVHHAGKSGDQRGTSGREDILDTVIKLKPLPESTNDGARFLVEFTKSRRAFGEVVETVEVALDFQSENFWTCKTHEESTLDRMLDLAKVGIDNVKEMSEALGVSKGQVSKLKRTCINEGLFQESRKIILADDMKSLLP